MILNPSLTYNVVALLISQCPAFQIQDLDWVHKAIRLSSILCPFRGSGLYFAGQARLLQRCWDRLPPHLDNERARLSISVMSLEARR